MNKLKIKGTCFVYDNKFVEYPGEVGEWFGMNVNGVVDIAKDIDPKMLADGRYIYSIKIEKIGELYE